MRRAILLVTVMLTAVVVASSAAYANHWWMTGKNDPVGYHWALTGTPFTLKVGDNVDDTKWDAYLDEAIKDWSQSSVLDLTEVAGGTRPKNCRATSGRIEACSERYGNNGWLGMATIWISGDHITQATTKVNDTYFNTSTYNTPAWRRLVMCQEIAHDFGLDHQDENFDNGNLGSCMDYTSDPDGPPSNEHPNTHDYAQLVTIYDGHNDGTTTIGQSADSRGPFGDPNDPRNVPGDGPRAWGREVFRSADGRASVFVLDFGRGYKKVTHVRWTEERAAQLRGER